MSTAERWPSSTATDFISFWIFFEACEGDSGLTVVLDLIVFDTLNSPSEKYEGPLTDSEKESPLAARIAASLESNTWCPTGPFLSTRVTLHLPGSAMSGVTNSFTSSRV